MSVLGQNRKGSPRANVFRFCTDIRHGHRFRGAFTLACIFAGLIAVAVAWLLGFAL
jgi:hypothetical protein